MAQSLTSSGASERGDRIVVTITGAAGRIAYALIPLLLSGSVFGPSTYIDLRLLDMPICIQKLEGVKLEIEDSCYDLLDNLVLTADPREAFVGCEVAILLGGYPRLDGEERNALLTKNAPGFRDQGRAISEYASRDCRVIVIANPANTNCLVGMRCASNIPSKNWTSLSRLDHERLRGAVSRLSKFENGRQVLPSEVRNCLIFGNHSATQVPFVGAAEIKENGEWKRLGGGSFPGAHAKVMAEMQNVIPMVQSRGAEVIRLQKAGSAFSAAKAIVHQIQDWLGVGSCCDESEVFSLGVLSDGNSYGVPSGLVYSLPCVRVPRRAGSKFCDYQLVNGLELDPLTQELLKKTSDDLVRERGVCQEIIPELRRI